MKVQFVTEFIVGTLILVFGIIYHLRNIDDPNYMGFVLFAGFCYILTILDYTFYKRNKKHDGV